IAPISCLLASVFLLGNLNRHNEITALKASGIGLMKIMRPIFVGAVLVGICIFILSERVVPYTMRMANKIRYEDLEVGKRGSSKVMSNVAIYGRGNRIIFAKQFDFERNTLDDVIIHYYDEKEAVLRKISVKKMSWENKRWVGTDVVIYNINKKGEFLGTPEIAERKIISLNETPLDFINNQWQPQYMSYGQLKKYLTVFLGGSMLAKRRFSVDLNYKVAFPFSCLVMILVACPFTLVTARGAALLGMAKGIIIALTYIPLLAIGLALGKGGTLPPFLAAWLANIVLGGLGLYLTVKH
ncbi:MAG: LptF/LptG family permease, partial [Candidatus Omnitrophota bacterium]